MATAVGKTDVFDFLIDVVPQLDGAGQAVKAEGADGAAEGQALLDNGFGEDGDALLS